VLWSYFDIYSGPRAWVRYLVTDLCKEDEDDNNEQVAEDANSSDDGVNDFEDGRVTDEDTTDMFRR